jgi:hypothetical protein
VARLVIAGLTREEQLTTQAPLQICHVHGRDRRLLAVAADYRDFGRCRGCGKDAMQRRGARGR